MLISKKLSIAAAALCLFAALAVLSSPIISATSAAEPSARDIVKAAASMEQTIMGRRNGLSHTMSQTTETLDASGKVMKSEKKSERVKGQMKSNYVDVAEEDKADKRATGTRDGGASPATTTAAKSKKAAGGSFHLFADYNTLYPRFDYVMDGRETVGGVPCYRIKYTPKAGAQPAKSREEKILNRMHGTMWITVGSGRPDDHTIIRNEGELPAPVQLAWVFAVAEQVKVSYRAAKLPNGDFGPSRISLFYKISLPFGIMSSRQVHTFTDWALLK